MPAGSASQYADIVDQLSFSYCHFVNNTNTEHKAENRKNFIQNCEISVNWFFSHADYQLNAKESYFNKILKKYREQNDKDAELDSENKRHKSLWFNDP